MSTEVDFVASLESRGNEHNGSRLLKLGTKFYLLEDLDRIMGGGGGSTTKKIMPPGKT